MNLLSEGGEVVEGGATEASKMWLYLRTVSEGATFGEGLKKDHEVAEGDS